MKISIIIPVYRVEKYLERCLKSVAGQTHKDLEIILVDDGSDDACPAICDEWAEKDKRIKVIHKANGGLSSARNAGLQIVTGDFVGFVDSDDWIHPQMYEILHDLLVNNIDCQLAECAYQNVKVEKNIVSIRKIKSYKMDRKQMLDRFFRVNGDYYNPVVWTKLLRRNLVKDFSFVDTLNEDWEATYYWYSKANMMIYTNIPLYYYFFNGAGIINSPFKKERMQYLSVWDRLIKKCREVTPEYNESAIFGARRARFTLLTQYVFNGTVSDDEEYREIYVRLREEVRENFFELLWGLNPLSRKVFLVLLLYFPRLCGVIGKMRRM